jgi:hypothetical protein
VRACAAEGDELAAVMPKSVLLFLTVVGEVSGHSSEVLLSRSAHVCEDGLAGTSVDDTTAMRRAAAEITLGQTQGLGKPVHDNSLKLSDSRTADPVEVGAVEGIRVHLGQGSRVAAGAGEEGHEARTRPVGDTREDLGLDVIVDGGPRLWVVGGCGGEKRAEIAWFDV